MKHQTDCKHGTKITGQCAYCGEYPYDNEFASILQSSEDSRRLQLMHRTVGQPWDEKAEHENDLRFESRQDFATWERDGDTGSERGDE